MRAIILLLILCLYGCGNSDLKKVNVPGGTIYVDDNDQIVRFVGHSGKVYDY